MTETLLNYEETAERLRIKPDTLQRWVAARKVPHIRMGRRVLFRERHVDEIIGDREQAPLLRRPRTRRQ